MKHTTAFGEKKKVQSDPFFQACANSLFLKDRWIGRRGIYAQTHACTLNRLKQGHAEGQAVSKCSHSVK